MKVLPTLSALGLAVLSLSALAQDARPPVAAPSGAAPVVGGVPPGPPPGVPSDPAPLKPFADVSKDFQKQEGLFSIWRKDTRVLIEIPRALLNKPFLFTVNIASSIGERGAYASQMGTDAMAEFRLIGRNVQLVALNTKFRAEGEGKRAVEQAFSPSLLGASTVVSADSPDRKSFLVDASFLLSDIPSYSTHLELAYRLPYALDRGNSYFEATRADFGLSTLTARMHFATPRIPAPPLVPSPVPVPTPPQSTPDPRSFFLSFVYNFKALPESVMATRPIDPRLGHFMESYVDLDTDLNANPRVHLLNHWRLEKKDPDAAMSEPVKAITFWMDKNIPARYRKAVEEGILEWNKAFEKIGFKGAVVAKQQPDDANWDNMDAGHASVRWFVGADVGFAIGPSHTDPRSGEILDADIGMSDVFARGSRRLIVEDVGAQSSEQRLAQMALHWKDGNRFAAACNYAVGAAQEMNFAMDILEARGELDPSSPEAEAFVNEVIKDVIMHEVGHTLGLKHNFKASTVATAAQLRDKGYTDANGIASSVMDYAAFNISLKGEPKVRMNMHTLGAYDYWAIEYAYKPLTVGNEKAELEKIASRSKEPGLIYGDDVDAGWGNVYDGMDPLANRRDLSSDPLAFFQRRVALSRELWARIQDRGMQQGDDPLRARRSLLAGFNQLYASAEAAAKYVGGMTTLRDLPGPGARTAFTPVDPAKQREALKALAQGVFAVDSFKFRPEYLSNLRLDHNEWDRGGMADILAAVARLQLTILDRLLGANTARRLLDSPSLLPEAQRRSMLGLSEMYGTVQSAVWSEIKSGGEIDRLRRNLQREHLKRVVALLTKGAPLPADALALVRWHAGQLMTELRAAQAKGGGSVDNRAHVAESLSTLTEALRATMSRV
jgi:Met-zincin/Domain of unknown function (DUF5117)/Domain of unknown function (DUF5118)